MNEGIAAEQVKKKPRAMKKPFSQPIVGATLEVIQKSRTEKPDVLDAAREERIKKTKDEKKAKKAETMARNQKTQNKGGGGTPKVGGSKGPKLGGGGGKR